MKFSNLFIEYRFSMPVMKTPTLKSSFNSFNILQNFTNMSGLSLYKSSFSGSKLLSISSTNYLFINYYIIYIMLLQLHVVLQGRNSPEDLVDYVLHYVVRILRYLVLPHAVVEHAALVLSPRLDVGLQEALHYGLRVLVVAHKQQDVIGVLYLEGGSVGQLTLVLNLGDASHAQLFLLLRLPCACLCYWVLQLSEEAPCEGLDLFVLLEIIHTDVYLLHMSQPVVYLLLRIDVSFPEHLVLQEQHVLRLLLLLLIVALGDQLLQSTVAEDI
jgi:hypothetical protein